MDFIETCFTGQAGFIGVRYLATNNGLPINNLFLCHDNVVKTGRKLEPM
jgi:hypothetical protein